MKLGLNRVLMCAALLEIGAGLGLTFSPAGLIKDLIGIEATGATLTLGRMVGISLLALGAAGWPSRRDPMETSAVRGLLSYNALVAIFLLWVATAEQMAGPLLWLTIVLHAGIALLLVLARREAGKSYPASAGLASRG